MRLANILLCTSLFIALPLDSKPVLEFSPTDAGTYSAAASIHPDAAIVFTSSFEGLGPTFEAQASDVLKKLETALELAELDLSSVANVRGYLRSPNKGDMSERMRIWNQEFTATFGGNPNPPTRTTIGVTQLIEPESQIAIDAILAVPHESLGRFESLLSNSRLSAPDNADATLRAISPFSSLLITSGVLADPVASGGSDFGDMSQQTLSVLEKLETVMLRWGLNTGDLAFVRVLLSPAPEGEDAGALDTVGFHAAWESFWGTKRSTPPPVSTFSSPGFSSSGRLIEIEFYATFPDGMGPFSGVPDPDVTSPSVILRDGNPNSFLSSSVAIARDAKKTWFSGVISRDRNDIYGQGVEALLTLEERYATLSIDLSDTAQLRAYLNLDGPFRSSFGRWNRAYRRFFDHAILNPEKPVRTAFPVENLPGSLFIEIETIAATRD